jgi:hypothetical protein
MADDKKLDINLSDLLPDTQVVSRPDRIKQTPISDGAYKNILGMEGQRGHGAFYPSDQERIDILGKYGTDHVNYDRDGEPNFSIFAQAQVRIANMEGGNDQSRRRNFANANRKLLHTPWAEERGLKTQDDIKEYMSEHQLTWHEKSDGITMQLLPREINRKFGHVGGVSTIAHLYDTDEEGLRKIGNTIGSAQVITAQNVVKVTDTIKDTGDNVNEFIDNATHKFISEDFTRINRAGLDAATEAAIFAGTISIVRNTIAVVKGEKEKNEAVKEVIIDTSTTAATAYVTGALAEKFTANLDYGDAAIVVTGAVQISKQVISYVNGEIDKEQLATNIAETGSYLVAGYIGKNVGKFIGKGIGAALGNMILPVVGGEVGALLGAEIGKIVGEIITTTICTEVISTINFSKEFKKKNANIISLYRQAELEIRASQARLTEIIRAENQDLNSTINVGFETIYEGIKIDSYSKVKEGIMTIGTKFGLSEEDFSSGHVTRENLFKQKDQLLLIE